MLYKITANLAQNHATDSTHPIKFQMVVVVVVVFSLLARITGECSNTHSSPALVFFLSSSFFF